MSPKKIDLLNVKPLTAKHLAKYSPQMIDNILFVLDMAKTKQFEKGLKWYHNARSFCRYLSIKYDIPLESAVGIVAVLSPNLSWRINKNAAELIIQDENNAPILPGYPKSKAKALRILWGENPIDVIGGNKVTAFYHNILKPNDDQYVTLDTWASRIATLDHSLGMDTAQVYLRSLKYDIVANAYKVAATDYGILPLECQAITWITYRDLYGREGMG